MHSTLVMGRMGRYERNMMLWVRPNNYKLIDRSIRYCQRLLQEDKNIIVDYHKVAKTLLELESQHKKNDGLVLMCYLELLKKIDFQEGRSF